MSSSFGAKIDCRHFDGEKPCKFKRLCKDCDKYDPQGKRILIIKLGALGDVLRTTSLLPALAKKYPKVHITWLTQNQAAPLLRHSGGIDRICELGWETKMILEAEEFDLLICLDKDKRALALAKSFKSEKKFGFGLSRWGCTEPLNKEADYSFRLGIDDDLKFHRNKKTYQEIVHEICGLKGEVVGYRFKPPEKAKKFGRDLLEKLGIKGKKVVGLNTGAGFAFANKAWPAKKFIKLAEWLKMEAGMEPLLLGGPSERKLNRQIADNCKAEIADSHGEHDLIQFAGLIGELDMIITSDSLAMHFGLAQKIPTVAMFGSTCLQEIMLTGQGELISAGLDCQPCYKQKCEKTDTCMTKLSFGKVKAAVERVMEGAGLKCA